MIEIESSDHAFVQEIEPILNADPQMSYDEFFRECLIKNRPCVFNSDLINNWESKQNWVSNGAPNFEYLQKHYGFCEAPISICHSYLIKQIKETMSINKYIDYWIKYKQNSLDVNNLLYLKDWHCVGQSNSSSFYQVPQYFASDWLNEYCIAKNLDDYMFVYMGPKGTWTPFHVDVLTSYSWSANICGKKKWLFFPPEQEEILMNNRNFNGHDVTSVDICDLEKLNNCNEDAAQCIEIIQESGQVVFVPSGWYHQVWNLEDTISINHNWLNGCNIHKVWSRLKSDLLSVIKEICDCTEMDNWKEHCQLILKVSFGLDYLEFFKIIEFIAEKRLESILKNVPVVNFNKWLQGFNHNVFDLKQIKIVLEDYAKEIEEKSLTDICSLDKVCDLSNRITAAI